MKTLTKKVVAPFAVSLIALGVGQAMAYEAGDILVRGGIASVNPDSDSDDILPGAIGSGNTVEVDSGMAAGISATYMFSSNLGLEILASTPFTHDIDGKGSVLGGVAIGETKHLPPTVSVQYNFPMDNNINVYAGLGINFTTFFSEDEDDELKALLGNDVKVKLKDSYGLAASAGIDYQIDEHWGVNAGVYLIDIDTEAKLSAAAIGGTTKFDVNIDPMVYRLNAVYKF